MRTLLVAAVTATSLAVPAAAGAAPPGLEPEAGDQPAAATAPARTADDCSEASLRKKAAKAQPAGDAAPAELRGKKVFTCLGINRAASGDAAKARAAALAEARNGGGVEAQDVLPLPEFCYEHAFDGLWWGNRTENCMIGSVTVLIYLVTNGVRRHIGTAEALETNFSYTSDSVDTFAYQLAVRKYWGERYGNFDFFAQIYGFASCDGDCKPNGDTGLRPGWFRNRVDNEGESYWDSSESQPGGIGYSRPHWTYRVQFPGTLPSDPREVGPPEIRCDNAFEDDGNVWNDPDAGVPTAQAVIGAGCVFLGYVPSMSYSKTGTFADLAKHVEAAQQSGLPGAYPNGVPLRRLQDSAQRAANGALACPAAPVWVRPTGKSCDEYPPRSTKQGAAQPPVGTARTFAPPNTSWCQMDPAWNVPTGVTGPAGWSSCMLPATQNSVGGSLLGGFYRRNRVLDNDPFFIYIAP